MDRYKKAIKEKKLIRISRNNLKEIVKNWNTEKNLNQKSDRHFFKNGCVLEVLK